MEGMVIAKMVTSIAVCGMGGFCMWVTSGKTGIGWAILGLFFVWA